MSWSQITRGNLSKPDPSDTEIFEAYFMYCAVQGSSPGVAIFSLDNSRTAKTTAYFSPAAVALAAQFRATPCIRPERHGLRLIAGQVDSLDLLNP